MDKKGNITSNVRKFRLFIDITQEELAQRVGVSRQTINLIEKNKYNPTLILAYQLSKTLNAKIDELFNYNDQ